jgi:NADH-ubiquinone oxidoreductase chain 5
MKNNSFRFYVLKIHESSFLISFALLVLSFGSIFFGFIFKDLFIGLGSTFLLNNNLIDINGIFVADSEFLPANIKSIPLFLGFSGFLTLIFIIKI